MYRFDVFYTNMPGLNNNGTWSFIAKTTSGFATPQLHRSSLGFTGMPYQLHNRGKHATSLCFYTNDNDNTYIKMSCWHRRP